ncbi:hypothetical protein [Mameliella alba]|uniref:hypothetical protein n=1 Tax=Mameliella alba TaxID=561184 RepID=UPI0011B2245B|nr:hypothetical protein [Mameliella alba]
MFQDVSVSTRTAKQEANHGKCLWQPFGVALPLFGAIIPGKRVSRQAGSPHDRSGAVLQSWR